MPESWKEFVRKKRYEYFRTGPVPCPAFCNEMVYFEKQGFNHLIRRGRIPREVADARERLELFAEASNIIASSQRFVTHRRSPTKESSVGDAVPEAQFWAFKGNSTKSQIVVVVRQVGSGRKHFFSIMKKSREQSTKTPKGP